MDPRFIIAATYRVLKNAETIKRFEEELNNCNGPDDAIDICYRYQEAVQASGEFQE